MHAARACVGGSRSKMQIIGPSPPPTPPQRAAEINPAAELERSCRHNDLKSTFTSLEAIVPRAQKVHLPFARDCLGFHETNVSQEAGNKI